MPSLIACCLLATVDLAAPAAPVAVGPGPAASIAPLMFVQAEQPRTAPPAQARPRGGSGERPSSQNPMVQQMLRDPDLQQQIIGDPRFQGALQDSRMQSLMQSPQVQQQMQKDQRLRELYQLQRRPLPGVGADDDDD